MAQTSIEWTELTWNPTTGCTKISSGCKFCYAEIMSGRLKAMGIEKYKNGFDVRTHVDALSLPYTWRGTKMVFVNSMSDLFHPSIPFSFIKDVFTVMNQNKQHVFQVLTKRADRLVELHKRLNWTDNIWMGVSVEDERVLDRVDFLRQTDAKTKFLSCEPLIGPLDKLNLYKMDWVIVGGESGRNPRVMKHEWVIQIKENCFRNCVPFFFKQWGGKNKKENGRILNGNVYSEMPKANFENSIV
jgi:protein gp37